VGGRISVNPGHAQHPPGDPIRRGDVELLHGNCRVRRYRLVAGGAAPLP
jgi:hypothetical protein